MRANFFKADKSVANRYASLKLVPLGNTAINAIGIRIVSLVSLSLAVCAISVI